MREIFVLGPISSELGSTKFLNDLQIPFRSDNNIQNCILLNSRDVNLLGAGQYSIIIFSITLYA